MSRRGGKGPGITSWKKIEDEAEDVFRSRRVLTINLEHPEACLVLKDILKSVASGSEKEQVGALKDLLEILPDEREKAIGASVFLLENGLLPVVVSGLESAAWGDWLLLEKDPSDPCTLQVLNKASIYAEVMQKLITDTRSTNYILEHAPNVLDTLKKMFCIRELPMMSNDTSGAMRGLLQKTGIEILEGFLRMLNLSKQAQRKLARFRSFFEFLLGRCLEDSSDQEYVIKALQVFLWLSPSIPAPDFEALATSCLKEVTKVLSESESRFEIEIIIVLLGKLPSCHFPIYNFHFLTDATLIDCAKAVALCSNMDPFGLVVSSTLLWCIVERRAGRPVTKERYNAMLSRKFTEAEEYGIQEAIGTNSPWTRAEALERIYSQEESPFIAVLFNVERDDEGAPINPRPQETPAYKRPLRKCSAGGCKSFETRSGEFKLCSQCKLTAYCSRACQKGAWKAGHKQVCQ